jgi:glycosyltransferase involved in cell wall biosynthesis
MSDLRVYPFTLTDAVASEHIYGRELADALSARGVEFVEDWRDADVVHLFEVNVFTRDAIAAFEFPELLRVVRSDTPLVVSTDDLYFVGEPSLTARPRLYGLNARVQRWLFRRCDAIVAISESVKHNLERAVPGTEIAVVHHGVNERYFSDPDPDAEPFVLHVSLASKRKNPDAIRAVAEALDTRFVVAGGGWDEYLRDDYGNVEVLGYVPEDELVRLYEDAGVFYFPTLHEGFGLPVLEAMAAANAVVSSDVYSVPEVAGDAAVLHDPRDVDGHLGSLRSLVRDDDRRTTLARRARARAERFSWEQSAAGTVSVYESVVPE